jgi:hypothetical protein
VTTKSALSWRLAGDPGRQQHEYAIQMETLLNTFRCGSATAPARVP